jgi:hypothetical protein
MATTTTNYGWAIPTSTDLVKDGATAIATLGSAIDTSVNTALGTKKAGMVLLNTTSFSGVSSQSFNDVFSTTYDNYRILCTQSGSEGGNYIRLRVSGSDNSTASSYVYQNHGASGSSPFAARTTDNRMEVGGTTSVLLNSAAVEIFNPFLASATNFSSLNSDTNGNARIIMYAGTHNQTVSYTGFTWIFPSATTGTISVYGYSK